MDLRTFMRFHFLKVLLGVIVIQLVVIVIVQNYNHKPVAERDVFSVIENRDITVKPLVNDSDEDDNTELIIKTINDPAHGTVELKGNRFMYTPETDFVGFDSIGYTCSDGSKESEFAYVLIEVLKNMPPLAENDRMKAYIKSQINLFPLLNDKDNEGDTIFINDFTQPQIGKISYTDNTFQYSASGTAAVDSFSYTLSDGKSISESAWVVIDVNDNRDPEYPWYKTGVGNYGVPCELSIENNVCNIKASGSDLWGSADGFSFIYQNLNGDGEIKTKIESYNSKQEWARAGIMIRENMNAGSKNYFIGITSKHGICNQGRLEADAGTQWWYGNADLTAPCWLKIKRSGNTFSSYTSTNGTKWEKVNEGEINMAENIYIGYSVTNQNAASSCDAVFSLTKVVN